MPSINRTVWVVFVLIVLLTAGLILFGRRHGEAAGGSFINVADSGALSHGISMVLDGSGNPVASYYDPTTGDVKVLRCNDPACLPR